MRLTGRIHFDPWFAADVQARGGYEREGQWHEKLVAFSEGPSLSARR